jgi:hypothetical protein
MTALDGYGIGALALLVLVFYFVRRIGVYVALGLAITAGFVLATHTSVDWARPSEWLVMTAGLLACIFGLLIVRVMLIRSVSLRLLARIENETEATFGEDIGGRLRDMRSFRLIHTVDGRNTLTPFGRLVSGLVAASYSVLGIRA